ncbi:MAG: arginine--tRNA ligase, partial [Deltaproteobacteria bacterium]|nr:arginine--tRNA ligase [Deltaproteobacteria bacterium]
MKARLKALLAQSLDKAHQAGLLKTGQVPIEVEKPRLNGHGDLATNLALILASAEKRPPREVAAIILDQLGQGGSFIAQAEVAGPGFINFTLSPSVWQEVADRILEEGQAYGRSDLGQGRRVQVEFVSANPTGPLHVGHGRGAALGDALANLLAAVGFDVQREYYINDAGRQMLILGQSVFARYQENLGRKVDFPQEGYQGDYIRDIAARMVEQYGPDHLEDDPQAAAEFFSPLAAEMILDGIRDDLAVFGVKYDCWFSEKSL